MTSLKSLDPVKNRNECPTLMNGDRMKQPEFHKRYEQHPGDEKFELIGGIVYMASPTRWLHGQYAETLGFVLTLFTASTPGFESASEASAILGGESEPQPDMTLRIAESHGGRSHINVEEYLEGPPELLAEIAFSSRNIDLNQKRVDYEQAGVLEYLVYSIEDERLFWFHFPSASTIGPNRKGVACSTEFPGLWIDHAALVARDLGQLQKVLQQGVRSKAHAQFVRKLQRAARDRSQE